MEVKGHVFQIYDNNIKVFFDTPHVSNMIALSLVVKIRTMLKLIPSAVECKYCKISKVGQRSRSRSYDQNLCYHQKGIDIRSMPNMKVICLMVRKFCAELKLFKCRSKVTVKVTCSKFIVSSKKSCH